MKATSWTAPWVVGVTAFVAVAQIPLPHSSARADDDIAIYAYVDYDCTDCDYTAGDYVDIYYKQNPWDPDPGTLVDTKYITWHVGVYFAKKTCPMTAGCYKVIYHIQDEDCGWLIRPPGWQYMDCSDDLKWFAYCQSTGTK